MIERMPHFAVLANMGKAAISRKHSKGGTFLDDAAIFGPNPLYDKSRIMVWSLIEEREGRPCWNNRDGLNPEDYSRLKIED
jgi:hypothetical protein